MEGQEQIFECIKYVIHEYHIYVYTVRHKVKEMVFYKNFHY